MERSRIAWKQGRLILAVLAALILAQAVPAQQGAGRFVVQVGAYAGPRAAAPLAGELTRRGFPALVVPGGDYYRVVVGPFGSEAEANTALARLQQLGYQGYIRSDLPIPQASQPAPQRPAQPAAPAPAPAAPRPQAAPAAAQSAATRRWVVQLAAFDDLQSAAPFTQELLGQGFSAIVVPGDDYQRVVVGPFAQESEATAMLSRLQQGGYQGYVRNDLRLPTQGVTVAQAEPAAPPVAPVSPPEPAAPPAEPEPAAAPQPEPAAAPQPEPPQVEAPTAPTPARAATREVEIPEAPAVPAQPTQPEPATVPPTPEPGPAAPAPVAEPPAPQPVEPGPPVVAEAPEPGAAPVSEPQQQGIATLFPPEPAPAPEPQRPRAGSSLRLLVLAGQDAINNIKQRTARDPVVQVVDENDRPVAGAAITFALPDRGASGTFANGARSVTMLTDAQGRATAIGLTPNAVEGDVPIQVTASYQGQTASTVILQSNVVAAGAGISAATIGIIGAVAAGVAVGAVLAFGGGDNGTAPPAARPSGTATVNTGGVTIGAPSQ